MTAVVRVPAASCCSWGLRAFAAVGGAHCCALDPVEGLTASESARLRPPAVTRLEVVVDIVGADDEGLG